MSPERVDAELLASEERFQTLFRANIIGVVVADIRGEIREANDEYLRIVGFSRAEFDQGMVKWRELTPPEWKATDDAAIDQIRRTGSCAAYSKEYQRRDGVRVPVIVGATLLDRASGDCVCFALDDSRCRNAEAQLEAMNGDLERRVRERTASLVDSETRAGQAAALLARSEHRLRTLAAHLQRVCEEERAELAREIHDVLGQELTGLKMDAAWISRGLKQARQAAAPIFERLDGMQAQIDSALVTVRRIATELRPAVLDDLGLVAALEWQAREFERRSGLKVTFMAPGEDVVIDCVCATAVFRIYQELLTNIARHAQATTVVVSLTASDGAIVLEVRDDGRGIREVDLAGINSLGLLGIRERAAALGGSFLIRGERNNGTVARVVVPQLVGGGP